MQLTSEQLHLMIPRASDRTIAKFLTPLNLAMKEYSIASPLRVAAFIAQIAHESGSLHYVEEIHNGSNYEFRDDLGNLEFLALQTAHANYSTTGKFYKGRGLIQLTGFFNFKACAEALNIDCLKVPSLLSVPINAARSAAWFFDTHNCNSLADVGLFDKISRVINGGTNGRAERRENYARCCKVLGIS